MRPVTHLPTLLSQVPWTPRDVALASAGPDESTVQELTLRLEIRRAERRYAHRIVLERCRRSWDKWTLENITAECTPWEAP